MSPGVTTYPFQHQKKPTSVGAHTLSQISREATDRLETPLMWGNNGKREIEIALRFSLALFKWLNDDWTKLSKVQPLATVPARQPIWSAGTLSQALLHNKPKSVSRSEKWTGLKAHFFILVVSLSELMTLYCNLTWYPELGGIVIMARHLSV